MLRYYTYQKANSKMLIGLLGSAGRSAILLFSINNIKFSPDEADILACINMTFIFHFSSGQPCVTFFYSFIHVYGIVTRKPTGI